MDEGMNGVITNINTNTTNNNNNYPTANKHQFLNKKV
jgi:hypothetical protein